MPFRLDCQYWFVTYSQCNVDKADILSHIVLRHPDRCPEWVRVVRERHEDGQFHLHALINWGSRLCTRNARFLDYTADDGSVYHPKLEPARSVAKSLQYVAKDDDAPYDYGTVPEPGESQCDSRSDMARRVLSTATSGDELLSMVREADPLHYVEKIFQWERVANKLFAIPEAQPDPVETRPFNNLHPDIVSWLDQEFNPEVSVFT